MEFIMLIGLWIAVVVQSWVIYHQARAIHYLNDRVEYLEDEIL